MENPGTDTESALRHKMKGKGTFIPGSVRIVDFDLGNKNVLVRGSAAFGALVDGSENEFQLSDLVAAIKNDVNYESTGIELGQNPQIVDFCLIGFAPDTKDNGIVNYEVAWFVQPAIDGGGGPYPAYMPATPATNPNTMIYWPIRSLAASSWPTAVGGTWNPSPAPSIGADSNGFNYAELIPAIRNALTNKPTDLPGCPTNLTEIKNAVIYIHCDSGVNRTGAATVGYLMTYGSDLTALNLPRTTADKPYTLPAAETAAQQALPSNAGSSLDGTDMPVAQAYCNYIRTAAYNAALVADCFPLGN